MTIDELRYANTLSIEIGKYNGVLGDCEILSKAVDKHEQFMNGNYTTDDCPSVSKMYFTGYTSEERTIGEIVVPEALWREFLNKIIKYYDDRKLEKIKEFQEFQTERIDDNAD
jgi:hypothetical protein